MFKRVLSIVIVVLLVFLCSCNGNNSGHSSNNNSNHNDNNSSDKDTASLFDKAKAQVEYLFPTYKSARQIYSVNISELDESIVVFLRQLQGLVAKKETASIYLVSNDADQYWLNYLCDELGAYSTEITPEQLVALYKDFIKTIVVYSAHNDEFGFAWNDSIRRDDAICVEYSVADKFELLNEREVISVSGVFSDEKASYESVFGMIESDENQRVFSLLDENSAFIDYAYSCKAFMLPECDDEWSTEFVKRQLDSRKSENFGVIYSDESVSGNALSVYTAYGYGNIAVKGFSNSTVFSSISIDYRFEKIKVNGSSPKKGKLYLSLVVDCANAGDVINNNYLVCNANREGYSVSFEYPLFMRRLAPATLLWYSVNAAQKGDYIIPDGNWLNIDQSAISGDMYDLWLNVNNYLIYQSGMSVAVTDNIINDDNKYLSSHSVDGVLYYSDQSLSGVYSKENKPILLAQKLSSLVELETSLNSLVSDKNTPLYFVYSLTADAYFEKLPIYDIHNGYFGVGTPDGYYTITEIIAVFLSNANSVNFVSPAQIVSYIKKG